MREDRARLGSRLLAFAALWFLLSGLLMVLSFVVVALVAYAALAAVVLALGARWVLERFRAGEVVTAALVSGGDSAGRVGRWLRGFGVRRRVTAALVSGGHSAGRVGRWLRGFGVRRRVTAALVSGGRGAGRVGRWLRGLSVRRRVRRAGAHARGIAAGTPDRVAALVERGLRAYALGFYRLSDWTAARRRPAPVTHDAIRLNELGAELRRRGEHERAAEQHRVALEIARDLGDEQAEALTLNSLALALAQAGAEAEAVQHLEQARVVLHELGDEEHEGQVIANLGLVYRRQGHSEEATLLFQEALERLPPESWAYRQVEAELSRAS